MQEGIDYLLLRIHQFKGYYWHAYQPDPEHIVEAIRWGYLKRDYSYSELRGVQLTRTGMKRIGIKQPSRFIRLKKMVLGIFGYPLH